VAGLSPDDADAERLDHRGAPGNYPVIHLPLVLILDSWVVPTEHNKNRLEQVLDRRALCLPKDDGRSDPTCARDRSSRQKRRHLDPAFHAAALNGLKKGRESRVWSDTDIMKAVRDFVRREGRAPQQHEFRNDAGMPGYGTVWRRLGPVKSAIMRALENEK
jgi:hypothetical protein